MEFFIDTVELQRVVKCMSVVAKTNASDITGRLLLEVSDSSVEFLINNRSTALYYISNKVKIVSTGSVSFAYDKIKTFISSIKAWDGKSGAKEILIVSDDKQTELFVTIVYENGKTSKNKLKVVNYSASLIPKPPTFGKATFVLNSTIFRHAINKVLYAINPSLDFSVAVLQGMNIKFDTDSIYFAGSDGKVLSEYQVKNVNEAFVEKDITLQHDFITGLRRLLVDDIQMMWEITDKTVAVKFDDVVFIGRKIVGHDYPDYKSALGRFDNSISIEREALLSSLLSFSDVFDSEDHNRIIFEIKDNYVILYNDSAKVEIDFDNAKELKFVIDINGRLLMQTLEAIKDDEILIKFSNENGVLIFDSNTFEDQKSLITPLRRRVSSEG